MADPASDSVPLPALPVAGPWFLLVTAAGTSARYGDGKKEFALIGDRSLLDLAISPFLDLSGLAGATLTAPAGLERETAAALSIETSTRLEKLAPCGFSIVTGASERRDSVRLGLEELAARAAAAGISPYDALVLVHDGARPRVSAALVRATEATARTKGACVPVTPLVDTPKLLGADGTVLEHPGRSGFGGAQTPQAFVLGPLLEAHRLAAAENWDCTDDASIWDRYVGPVAWIPGERDNLKVTYREDLAAASARAAGIPAPALRIGEGWDIHRLVEGRKLLLGGTEIPFEKGESGHSDGDVLWHAVIDALFGAASLGDIGSHFPPSDPGWKDADSSELARTAIALVRRSGWEPVNLDTTVTLERPRLGPFRDRICASMASALGMDVRAVSVKAKTKEGLDSVGRGEAIEARAIVLLVRTV